MGNAEIEKKLAELQRKMRIATLILGKFWPLSSEEFAETQQMAEGSKRIEDRIARVEEIIREIKRWSGPCR